MGLITRVRHTRRGFINRIKCGRVLALSLQGLDENDPDSTAFCSETETQGELFESSLNAGALPKSQKIDLEVPSLLSLLAFQIESEHAPVSDKEIQASRTCQPELIQEPPEVKARFEVPAWNRLRVSVENLPNGQRVESFDNGSIVVKDALGHVVEVRSAYGDCLFLEYGSFGQLEAFTRLDRQGSLHSFCKRDKHGAAVRDKDGRVLACGEIMTIDPWGCLYLHTFDGQYFCLDLVGGIHVERRRLFHSDGRIDYVTAVFAHDGFRMATMYAVTPRHGKTKARSARHRMRCTAYRFYGRDGTLLEFGAERELRERRPARALPPGTRPVDQRALRHPQAKNAWESLKEYLARQY